MEGFFNLELSFNNIQNVAENTFYFLRYIFVVLDFVLFAINIFLFSKVLKLRPIFHPSVSKLLKEEKSKLLDWKRYTEEWEKIKQKAFSNPPTSFNLSIISADSFVDHILIEMGFGGEHMADRIEEVGLLNLKSVDNLWRAHKIRNEIAHSSDFILTEEETMEILRAYENFLKEIGAIKEKNEEQ